MKSLYETDAVQWADRNAALLRARRYEEADMEHILEEIEALGANWRGARDSHALRVMEHLLKLRFNAGEQTLRENVELWRGSVALHQADLADILERSPSLRSGLDAALLQKLYGRARKVFLSCQFTHALTPPEQCPFTWEEVLGETQ